MKLLTTFGIGLISFLPLSSFAANLNWQDLRSDEALVLTQKLPLETADGKSLEIAAGSKVSVTEVLPLDGIDVVDADLKLENCEAELASEMAIILPEGGAEKSEVGVQLSKGCELEVFIEVKDFGGISFFEAVK